MHEHEARVNLPFVVHESVFFLTAQASKFLLHKPNVITRKPLFKPPIKWFNVFDWDLLEVVHISVWVVRFD